MIYRFWGRPCKGWCMCVSKYVYIPSMVRSCIQENSIYRYVFGYFYDISSFFIHLPGIQFNTRLSVHLKNSDICCLCFHWRFHVFKILSLNFTGFQQMKDSLQSVLAFWAVQIFHPIFSS